MDTNRHKIKSLITARKEDDFSALLHCGLDPNFERGWPIRLAARYGCPTIVETLLKFGANPHLLDESGASTLQLAVFSGEYWNTNRWKYLLSCCDSSQLADGAAVAIIFNNVPAVRMILATGRCNTNIPTTLTGKTIELLANGYKLTHLLNSSPVTNYQEQSPSVSVATSRQSRTFENSLSPYHSQRNLSPSVARFFHQSAGQSSLSPTRREIVQASSPGGVTKIRQ